MNVRPAAFVDSSDSVSKAINEITKNGIGVVVLKDRKYLGLITDRDIRRSGSELLKEKCEHIAVKAPFLTTKSSLLDIANAFFAGRWKALPVIEKNRVLGVVSRSDVLAALLDEKLVGKKKVSEVMSSPVVSIAPEATISQAKELMHKANVRRLIVAQDGALMGIISTFDLAEEMSRSQGKDTLFGDNINLQKTPVSSYMRSEIEVVSPASALAEAAKKMVDKDISALVVLDGTKPVGIVTARDIFETAIAVDEEPNVYISGLEPSDKEMYPEILSYCKDTLDKLKKSFEVRSLSVHIKKHGEKKYSLRARLQSNGLINVSAFAWSLPLALKAMRDELKKIMAKRKVNKMHGG